MAKVSSALGLARSSSTQHGSLNDPRITPNLNSNSTNPRRKCWNSPRWNGGEKSNPISPASPLKAGGFEELKDRLKECLDEVLVSLDVVSTVADRIEHY